MKVPLKGENLLQSKEVLVVKLLKNNVDYHLMKDMLKDMLTYQKF